MKIEVLDNGYVEFIEAWGTGKAGRDDVLGYPHDYECGIIEAARQSTQGSFRGWEEDAKLLNYLYTKHHDTPFEFAGLVIEVQAPIMVFREWHRHRTQSYNEMSARYAPLPDLCYLPTVERAMRGGGHLTKQAGSVGGKVLSPQLAQAGLEFIQQSCKEAHTLYAHLLDWGWPKELARGVLPVFQYSKMRASANLRNWLSFMTLRADPAAQWEIQEYARAVGKILEAKFPQTWALYQAKRATP